MTKQEITVYESTSYIPLWKRMAESYVAFQQSVLQSPKNFEICTLGEQEGKMSAAGHGGLSPRALSRTHAGKHISRNGAKTFKSLRIVC